MDSLSAREDLLTTHEHVVGVRVLWVFGVGHRVKGTHCKGELVQNVKVGVVLGPDQFSEELFSGRAENNDL